MKRCALLLALLAPSALHAQSCSVTGAAVCAVSGGLNIGITIGRAIQLTLSSANTTLTTPTPAHFDQGYAQTTGPTITVQSNGAYALSIAALTGTWSATASGTEPVRADKPADDLRWATASGGTYTALSTSPATFLSGTAAPTGVSATLYYRTAYAWNLDTPGSYSIQIVFTLIAP